jgi:hypothetical protein
MLWQFSQFIIATQTVALSAMFIIGAIDKDTFLIVVVGQGVSIISFSDDIAEQRLCYRRFCVYNGRYSISLTTTPLHQKCVIKMKR